MVLLKKSCFEINHLAILVVVLLQQTIPILYYYFLKHPWMSLNNLSKKDFETPSMSFLLHGYYQFFFIYLFNSMNTNKIQYKEFKNKCLFS